MRTLADRLAALRGPLAVVAAVSSVSSLGIGVMLPLMPLYAISLGASPVQLGLMTSAFSLMNTGGQLLAGVYMDRYGSLPFIRVGTALYAAGNALIATARDAVSLIAYRGFAGLGAGGNLIGSRVYIAQVAPRERMAMVNGVLASAASAGQVIGPAFGGTVVELFDLRAPFVIVAVTSGLAFFGLLTLPAPKRPAAATQRIGAPTSALNPPLITLLSSTLFPTSPRVGAGSVVPAPPLGPLAARTGRRRVGVVSTIPVAFFGLAMVLDWPR